MIYKGKYLKEVNFSFLLDSKIDKMKASMFIYVLVNKIGVEATSLVINDLAPGFDMLCGLKESCIYLGYWEEVDLVRMYVCSCKNFDENIVKDVITKRLRPCSDIKMEVIRDCDIMKEVERCKN